MNLHDLPFAFDDPIEELLAFHRRIERQLATLGALRAGIEAQGIDPRASACAAASIAFFSTTIELHHADESDLLAMLGERVRGRADRGDFDDLRNRLESEHRQMAVTWRGLRRCLEGLAEGIPRHLPGDLLQYFRALHAGHIAEEEASLHLFAARLLPSANRAALARGMAARRARRRRFQ